MQAMTVRKPGGFKNLTLIEQDIPEPGPGEIVVNWRATSLNYHDLLVANGSIPADDGRIPMSDGAGTISAIGEGVTRWAVGDAVMSLFFPLWTEGRHHPSKTAAVTGDSIHGCAVQYSLLAETAVTRMPQGLSFAEAATLPCAALTAWQALMVRGNMQAGDSVLVEGTGGVSIFALQLAKAAGANVIATTSSEAKAERLTELGADHVVNYQDDANWGRTVAKLSNGGVDHVLDIGGTSTLNQSIYATKTGGQVSLIGVLGGMSTNLNVAVVFSKQMQLNGVAVGSAEMQTNMVAAIEACQIKPILDQTFPLAELGNAFNYQASGKHFGKIIVDIA